MNSSFFSKLSFLTSAENGSKSFDMNSIFMNFFPMVLIFFVFYFLIIRPQNKKQQEQKDMLSNLDSSKEVVLSSGIYGKISSVPVNQDFCMVEISEGVIVKVDKKEIVKILG